MCEAGLNLNQFARNVAHVKYIQYAIEDARSIFGFTPPPALPRPGDLLCASEGKILLGHRGFDPNDLGSLNGMRPLHCYVVVRSGQSETYVVGGNVIDWPQKIPEKFGSVALLAIKSNSIATRGSLTECDGSKPCWLLSLGLKSSEEASYEKSPFSGSIHTLIERTEADAK
jgi:hypothetical protein